jgi:hypothetical protein
MATILFSGLVANATTRVVDKGAGVEPRLFVELQQPPDAMGTQGWSSLDPIPRATLEALLLATGTIK